VPIFRKYALKTRSALSAQESGTRPDNSALDVRGAISENHLPVVKGVAEIDTNSNYGYQRTKMLEGTTFTG